MNIILTAAIFPRRMAGCPAENGRYSAGKSIRCCIFEEAGKTESNLELSYEAKPDLLPVSSWIVIS